MPEPNRAQRGVREPSEPEQLLSASLRGLLRTRKTRTGLGPRRRRRAHARSPRLPRTASPGLARGTRTGGTRGEDRLPALGARNCSVPSCLRSPCQPAGLCLFSRLKGALRRWKTSLTSRQKRENGLGSKVVCWASEVARSRWGRETSRQARQKHSVSLRSYVIFHNLGLCAWISGHRRNSHNFIQLRN